MSCRSAAYSIISPPAGRDELDRQVDRFESAWQGRTPPEIEAFLPAGRAARPLLYELIKIDLEYRWRRPKQDSSLAPRP